MDDKLFEVFSGKTEVPEIVTDRIEAALNKIQEQQPDSGRDKIASFSHRGRSCKRRRILILSFAAVLTLGVSAFAAEKYLGISDFWKLRGREIPEHVQSNINKEVLYKEKGESAESELPDEIICAGTAYMADAKSAADVMKTELHVTLPEEAEQETDVSEALQMYQEE